MWPWRSPRWAQASPFWLCLRAQSHQIGRTSPRFNCECAAGAIVMCFTESPWLGLSFSPSFFCRPYNTLKAVVLRQPSEQLCSTCERVRCESTACLPQKHHLSIVPRSKTLIIWSWQAKLYAEDGLVSSLTALCRGNGSSFILISIMYRTTLDPDCPRRKVLFSDSGVVEMVGIML